MSSSAKAEQAAWLTAPALVAHLTSGAIGRLDAKGLSKRVKRELAQSTSTRFAVAWAALAVLDGTLPAPPAVKAIEALLMALSATHKEDRSLLDPVAASVRSYIATCRESHLRLLVYVFPEAVVVCREDSQASARERIVRLAIRKETPDLGVQMIALLGLTASYRAQLDKLVYEAVAQSMNVTKLYEALSKGEDAVNRLRQLFLAADELIHEEMVRGGLGFLFALRTTQQVNANFGAVNSRIGLQGGANSLVSSCAGAIDDMFAHLNDNGVASAEYIKSLPSLKIGTPLFLELEIQRELMLALVSGLEYQTLKWLLMEWRSEVSSRAENESAEGFTSPNDNGWMSLMPVLLQDPVMAAVLVHSTSLPDVRLKKNIFI